VAIKVAPPFRGGVVWWWKIAPPVWRGSETGSHSYPRGLQSQKEGEKGVGIGSLRVTENVRGEGGEDPRG